MVPPNQNADWRSAYETDGYVVLNGLLSAAELRDVREALARLLSAGPSGRNDFEGRRTQRVYTLVARGKPFEALAEHPAIVAKLDELSVPKQKVRQMSPHLQSMLGYSVHPPFMGQVTARHPRKVLTPEFANPLDD